MSAKTHRDHFVPQTYLEKFAHERKTGQFHVYRKDPKVLENGGTGCPNIRNLCVEGGLYDLNIPGLTDEERRIVDTFYEQAYENGWNSVYEKLVDEKVETVTGEDRRLILGMVCSLFFRNRSWLVEAGKMTKEIITRGYESSKQNNKDHFFLESEKIMIKDKTLDEVVKEQIEIGKPILIKVAASASINLLKKRLDSDAIHVVKNHDHQESYLTSDRPVVMMDPNSQHLRPGNPSNFLVLPIDHTHVIELIPDCPTDYLTQIQRGRDTPMMIFFKNSQQYKQSDNHLMGSEKGLKFFVDTFNLVNRGVFPWK
jgi:hypothetical protein